MTLHGHSSHNRNQDQRDRGFTLIELLVVVVIVGILAAIAVPVFLNQRKKAVDASIKSDLRNVAMAFETFVSDRDDFRHNVLILGGNRFENGWTTSPAVLTSSSGGPPASTNASTRCASATRRGSTAAGTATAPTPGYA